MFHVLVSATDTCHTFFNWKKITFELGEKEERMQKNTYNFYSKREFGGEHLIKVYWNSNLQICCQTPNPLQHNLKTTKTVVQYHMNMN